MITRKVRGGQRYSIAAMLGRRCAFEAIDAARAAVEREDRAAERKKWAGEPETTDAFGDAGDAA